MLRRLLHLFLRSPQAPSLLEPSQDQVVLYARVGPLADRPPHSPPAPVKTAPRKLPSPVSHRERLLSMKLEHTKICSPRRCERLLELGIATAGDLASANPEHLASNFGAPRKAAGVFRRYRRAIRLASAVPGMMPRDAMLLVSIHRRSVRGLASESPSALYRDLERYAESSNGRQQLRGRRIPSTRRLKRWIAECETIAIHTPLQARAA